METEIGDDLFFAVLGAIQSASFLFRLPVLLFVSSDE